VNAKSYHMISKRQDYLYGDVSARNTTTAPTNMQKLKIEKLQAWAMRNILTVYSPTTFVQSRKQNVQSTVIMFDRFSGEIIQMVAIRCHILRLNAPS